MSVSNIMVALSRSDEIDTLNLRESYGTCHRPLKHSQESLSCARVLSRGEKILTQSELLQRRDWLEGLLEFQKADGFRDYVRVKHWVSNAMVQAEKHDHVSVRRLFRMS